MITLCLNMVDIDESYYIDKLRFFIYENKYNINFEYIYIKFNSFRSVLVLDFIKSKFKEVIFITNENINIKDLRKDLIIKNKYRTVTHYDNINSVVLLINNKNITYMGYILKRYLELNVYVRIIFEENINDSLFSNFERLLQKLTYSKLERNILNFLESEERYFSNIYFNNKITEEFIFEIKSNNNIIIYKDLNSFYLNKNFKKVLDSNLNYTFLKELKFKKYNIMVEKLYTFFTKKCIFRINPSDIVFYLTEQCNMKCTYCYNSSSDKKDSLSERDVKKTLDYIFKYNKNKKNITLYGGEPTLNLKIINYIIEYIERKKESVSFILSTNLLELNESLIESIKKMISLGDLNISISVDGIMEIHDLYRKDEKGNGTYNKIMNNILKLSIEINLFKEINNIKNDFSITQLTMINHFNVGYLKNIVETFFKNTFITDMNLYLPNYNGKKSNIFLTEDDFRFIFTIEEYLYKKYTTKHSDLDKMFSNIGTKNKGIDITYHKSMCSTNRDSLAIRSNGDIAFCYAFYKQRLYSKHDFNVKNLINSLNITMDNTNYMDLYMPDLIERNIILMKSELGFKCNECSARNICRQCQSYLDLKNGIAVIKPMEICLQSLSFWNCFLDKRDTEIDDKFLHLIDDFKYNNSFITKGMEILYDVFKKN